jgi:orotate phosphoribosyltransferase-like protein
LGRPNGFKTKINERLEKGMSTDEIVAELNCSRNIVNQYRRKRRLAQDAASSQAA